MMIEQYDTLLIYLIFIFNSLKCLHQLIYIIILLFIYILLFKFFFIQILNLILAYYFYPQFFNTLFVLINNCLFQLIEQLLLFLFYLFLFIFPLSHILSIVFVNKKIFYYFICKFENNEYFHRIPNAFKCLRLIDLTMSIDKLIYRVQHLKY